MNQMLTAKQVAEINGYSYQYAKKIIKEGKLKSVESVNEKNRKTYLVPLSELDIESQNKWYQMNNNCKNKIISEEIIDKKPIDHFSELEREEIDFWIELIGRWQDYRNKQGVISKAIVDENFETLCKLEYPEKNISIDILYRKWKAIKEKDYDGLVDKRGKWKKGKSTIDDTIWQAFLSFYLDESQHPIQKCLEYTQMWAQESRPDLYTEIPSYSAFYRRIQNDITEGVKILGREGEKAFKDRCAPYIRRVYDEMKSNEWWVADNHTFDVMVVDANGKQHRPYLTAFFDARSGIFTGYHVTYTPNSEATLIALRKGILKYGIPNNIYVDNGREFLTFDIGGLGHRKKKPKDGKEKFEPPGVFKRLGINMTNAIVRNAKAKIIERRFRDIKDHLSRVFDSFTGGNVLEKPERLKKVLKDGKLFNDQQFNEIVETTLEWYFNQQEYHGAVVKDRGKKRIDIYNENLISKRTASAEELSLMLMRSSRPQKVTRRGIHLDISGRRIDYWNDELITTLLEKQVYFRYDPEDLSEVRIYDLEDRYIMSVPADNKAILEYGASKEEIKEGMRTVKKAEKITKEALKISVLPECDKKTALELVIAQAQKNKTDNISKANPKIIKMQRAIEEPVFKKVVGGADLDIMNKNAMKKQGGQG